VRVAEKRRPLGGGNLYSLIVREQGDPEGIMFRNLVVVAVLALQLRQHRTTRPGLV
jgi:hypothetical protein